jgi:hypothetical protein
MSSVTDLPQFARRKELAVAKLVVSTWNRGSRLQQNENNDSRISSLNAAVKATAAQIAAQGYESSGLVKGIFVAPEYFFAAKYAGFVLNGGGKVPRPIGAVAHDDLLRKLDSLSRAFPRILIVPGTVAWKKPFDLAELQARERYYRGRAAHMPPLTGEPLTRALRAEYQRSAIDSSLTDSADRARYKRTNNLDMPTELVSEAEFDTLKTTHPQLYATMVQVVSALDRLGKAAYAAIDRYNANPGGITHTMQNTAYAFLNGQVVFRYSKQGNFHEEVGDSGLVFAPGARSGVQDIEGIKFGFEVCLDHNLGVLSRQLRAGHHIDVQVVTSDWVKYKPEHAVVRDGGYFVHASTNASATGVWQLNNGKAVLAPKLGAGNVDGTELAHWEVDVEVYDPFDLSGTFMQDLENQFPEKKKWTVNVPKSPFRTRG